MSGRARSFLWNLDRCQSPIERELFVAIALDLHDLGLQFWLNSQVRFGAYTADIVLGVPLKAMSPVVVIECDGHDFHERTKEQARHDRRRDRWMQGQGVAVFRFTGSEIFRNPEACATEVTKEFIRRTGAVSRA
jgi:very-short-patch-repair endonuclease